METLILRNNLCKLGEIRAEFLDAALDACDESGDLGFILLVGC